MAQAQISGDVADCNDNESIFNYLDDLWWLIFFQQILLIPHWFFIEKTILYPYKTICTFTKHFVHKQNYFVYEQNVLLFVQLL